LFVAGEDVPDELSRLIGKMGLNSKQMSQDFGEFKKQLQGRSAKTQKTRLIIANVHKSMLDYYGKMSEEENKDTQT
jgi:hypothetical protein